MSKLLSAVLTALVALVTLSALPAAAAARYTGSYSRMYQGNGYQYRTYTYYSPRAGQYKSHYAVYHPKYPRHVYYYNPAKKKYWGRYDLVKGGYSKLCERDKRGMVGEIEEGAFPPPGDLPPPEEGMDDQMLPPPEGNGGAEPPPMEDFILPYYPETEDGCLSAR